MKENLLVLTKEELKENQALQERIAELNKVGFFTTRLESTVKKGHPLQGKTGEKVPEYDGRGLA